VRDAAAAGDRRLEAQATVVGLRSQLQTDPKVDTDAVRAEAGRAVAVFETARDDARLAKTWELLAWAPWRHGQVGAAETALRRAIEHARRADDRRTEAQALNLLVGAAVHGPMPVKSGVELCEGILRREDEQLRTRAAALGALGAFRAMEGKFDEGRELLAEQRAILEDLGLVLAAAATAETSGFVELLAGDPVAAEREVRKGYETLEQLGETSSSSNLAAVVAHALAAQGRHDEALAFTELSEQASASDDVASQVLLRTARAKALAATGRGGDAEVLAREAVILAERTDFVLLHADALADLVEVLRERGAATAAGEALERALRLYANKGNVVAAKRLRALRDRE
jgi:tetratricopeptide (TPR) repeat protein